MNDAALFTDEPAPKDSSIFTDEPAPKSLGGFAQNIGQNTKELISGTGNFLKSNAQTVKDALTDPTAFAVDAYKTGKSIANIPEAISNEAGRIGLKDLAWSPDKSTDISGALGKFGNALYEKPISTAMDVFPFVGGEGKVAETAEKVAPMAEEAAKVPPVTPPTPSPVAPTATTALPPEIQDFLSKSSEKVKGAIPEEVKNYVGGKFNKAAETPINSGTIGKYAQENARNLAMKTLGASPGQIRKIGIPEANKLADYAFDKGIVNVKTGDIGAREKIAKINQDSGQIVGDMRNLAAQRGAVHDTNSLLSDIHSKIGDKYESGINSGEKSQYLKALEEVAKTPPTADDMATTITRLFKESKNQDRLKQPSGAFSDVARELRKANEDLMSKHLNPKELNVYHNALEDFGATTQLNEFAKRKQSTEMGGRLPPGMGVMRAGLQKGLDVVGYRGMAQIQNRIAKWLQENPGATKTPKEIFRKYVDESAEAIDDASEGLH